MCCQPDRIGLDSQPPAFVSQPDQQILQVRRGLSTFVFLPDMDVSIIQRRGQPGLPQIRSARQKIDPARRIQHHALEHCKAERVIAGQPILALGREQQNGVQPVGSQRLDGLLNAPGIFRIVKVQWHQCALTR